MIDAENNQFQWPVYDKHERPPLGKKMVESITSYYSDYVSYVKKYAKKIFKMRLPKEELEEILSFEVFDDTIIATAIYLDRETYDQRSNYRVSYKLSHRYRMGTQGEKKRRGSRTKEILLRRRLVTTLVNCNAFLLDDIQFRNCNCQNTILDLCNRGVNVTALQKLY